MSSDKVKILIVDDLPEKVLVIESVLGELGIDMVVANSGAEALHQVLRQEFAVILLDVNMPGIDGLETAALIRKRKKTAHVPIIFITAYADELHTAQGYSLGAVDYILTPVMPEILRSKVKVFVDLFSMTQQVKKQAEERIALMQEQAARAAAEESNRRLAFLAKAGNMLGRSLDYEATARDVAQLTIPALADASAVTLLQPGEGGCKTVLARATDNGHVHLQEIAGCEHLPCEFAAAIQSVLATGAAEPSAAEMTPATTRVVPLQARGRIIGALALSMSSSGRVFGQAEMSMVDSLASRAAMALDNALLYSDIQRADRQKNEFLSMLAHELRNPLAPIHNAVKFLRAKVPPDADLQWAQEVIDRQVMQMVRLVDDLLDVSRITRGKIRLNMQPIAVQSIVAQALETSRPLIDARNHGLSVTVPDECLWVRGDAVRLAQVLTNLLNNAAKYTDDGGGIELTVQHDEHDVILSVRDTGIGIPTGMMASIFEMFTQVDRSLDRSQGGLGIGLTLVKNLVEMHGGTVAAHSAGPGLGSEFTVRLPRMMINVSEPPQAGHLLGNELNAVAAKLRILVADDNEDAAESLAMLLRLTGYEVHTAFDGQDAFQAATALRPDVAFLDIGMPRYNGYEVAQKVRGEAWGRGMILIALTGWGQEEDRRRTVQAGFNHHLVKPVEHLTVMRLLAELEPTPA